MRLLIVESPSKIKKIQAYLGGDWKVAASVGHIRDLPKHNLGIEDSSYALQYEYIPPVTYKGKTFPGGKERIKSMAGAANEADKVYLATDPDREGEAIAWHLKEALNLDESDYERITFNEITKSAIFASIEKPRKIDYELVKAQEARRCLDRMVGYLVSPIISDVIGFPLSAGRVQSPAVLLVVNRERKILAFQKTNHFGVDVSFDDAAWLAKWNTAPFISPESPYILDQDIANEAANCQEFKVAKSETKAAKKSPPSPFSTSLLLQAASVSLKLDPEVTAKVAQKLFEQGLVTYIRTDSVNFGDEAITDIRILANDKGWPIPEKPRKFKTKADAQEAHEAIRPTNFELEEAGQTKEEKLLYSMIWRRSVASQLNEAEYRVNTLRLEGCSNEQTFEFVAKGRKMVAPGWTVVTDTDTTIENEGEDDSGEVPTIEEGVVLTNGVASVILKTTKPPARYTKASLIKKLEAEGIGRPATYPAIMQNIVSKAYVVEENRKLAPSKVGFTLVDQLVCAEFGFMDISFTRHLEEQLDKIESGKESYFDVVSTAHDQLLTDFANMKASGNHQPRFPCPKCETALKRYKRKKIEGHIWACSNDDCDTFMDDKDGEPVEQTVHKCQKCASPLRRYQKKDKETQKPKGFGWFCQNQEQCKTFLDDRKGSPIYPKQAPCPGCNEPIYRRKGTYGFYWKHDSGEGECKILMGDEKGKPVPKKKSKKNS